MAIEFELARGIFHMQGWGNLGGIFLLVTLGIVTFAALGLIIASVTNSTQETQVINQILWSAFLFLSGATLPLPMLPVWLQRFALFLPATYLVTGFERVMVARVGISQIGPEIIALSVSAAMAFFLSQQLFRWEPEEKVGPRAKALATATIVPFLLLRLVGDRARQSALRRPHRLPHHRAHGSRGPSCSPRRSSLAFGLLSSRGRAPERFEPAGTFARPFRLLHPTCARRFAIEFPEKAML